MKNRILNALKNWKNSPVFEKILKLWKPLQEKIKLRAKPYGEKLKTRWHSLASREKHTLMGGAAVTGVLLFYALIWSPMTISIDSLRQQILREKKTALWVEEADKQIRAFDKKQSATSIKKASAQLNALQDKIQQSPMSKHLTQLAQINANEIHCSFDQVDFDTLISWLITFSQQQSFTIEQATIRRLNNLGIVQAEFVLRV